MLNRRQFVYAAAAGVVTLARVQSFSRPTTT